MELLVVADCPNESPAGQRLRRALDESGHQDARIEVRVVTADTLGAEPAFAGSPTTLIDGVDHLSDRPASANAETTGRTGLSCRVYADGLSGAPTAQALHRALATSRPTV